MRHLVLAAALVLSGPSLAQAEGNDGLSVAVDHARILRIPREAGSVIIGNPSIADITIHDARTLVLTGRSYGNTNLVVLDGDGEVVLDDTVTVSSNEEKSVRIYRQAARTTFSCSPNCEPKVAIGDTTGTYDAVIDQVRAHDNLSTPKN